MTQPPEADPRSTPRATARRRAGLTLDGPIAAGALVILALTLLGLAGRWHWELDLMTHQRRAYAVLLLAAAAWFALRRRWVATGMCLAGLGVNAYLIAPLWLGAPRLVAAGSPELSIVSFNVHTRNPDKDGVAGYLDQSGADLIVVMEADQPWADRLEHLANYRVVASRPRQDNFGIMMLAREPPPASLSGLDAEIIYPDHGPFVLPAVEAAFEFDGRPVSLLAIHPLPPIREANAISNRAAHAWVAGWSNQQAAAGRAHLVVGDFNATPWCYVMRRLRADSTLISAQAGQGWSGSWPMRLRRVGLTIPIDHGLHSPEFTTTRHALGPALGSDHRPLELGLGWAERGE